MRTKTIIAAAAILAVSIATTVAQTNVYSQNVVGYINLTLTNALNLVANQLDVDGTGTNNTVLTVLGTNVPSGTVLYVWTGSQFLGASFGAKGWSGVTPAVNAAMNPGKGFFISVPSQTTVTLVGNVLQGSLANPYTPGWQFMSSMVPQAGLVQTALGYSPVSGDVLLRWNTPLQKYDGYSFGAKGWSPSQPSLNVGEAFWLSPARAGTWARNFTVQ